MQRYSALSVLWGGLTGQKNWDKVWGRPEPKSRYDVIIVGGGGHGLATAYYLAKEHGITNVAVIEKGWLGGGNAGRNTTIVRSNYMIPGNTEFYEHSLKLWENLSHELNYNVMFSQRAHVNLVFTPGQRDAMARRYNLMRLNGIDGEYWDKDELFKRVPQLAEGDRFDVLGAYVQPRAGTARHDAVNWGFARAATALGVDIIQETEVTGFIHEGGLVKGVEVKRRSGEELEIRADKIGLAVAGHTSVLAHKAGLGKLPIETHKLQAYVSEPIKPILDCVVVFGGVGHFYISQSDKGGMVYGGDLDLYPSYAQKGNLPVYEDVAANCMAVMPCLGRVKLLRQWAGVMDMSMDGSPFITKTDIPGLYLNAGWCYGGFKATPGSGHVFAHTIARDEPHWANRGLTLNRYREGRQIDESGHGPWPKTH
ncbi:sarcosine oxidase subunit beta family protein [Rhodobacteraceae bacterium NNCM2]|nr:sarcosine oxidase subunit beta family protein [Coraliihabitans acroporae]